MKKRIHLICNAHIDPIWQWEWEEGAAETLSTFRIAAKFCEEYGDFVFNHNEAILYRWIEEYEPELFLKIQNLVKAGKWHIMGGWHLQPDCNMPSGEGFCRQILEGRKYFKEKFNVAPTTAINFDPFGHTRGLVQIMKKSGYDSYLFCRPDGGWLQLESELFTWVGYDGSEIMARRCAGYGTALGHAVDKIRSIADGCPDDDFTLCLWGVGNHGGGPSKQDLDRITELRAELEPQGIEVVHSTPEEYFREVGERKLELPRHEGDLNLWAPGCYTSMARLKQKYRNTENMLFLTEKICSAAVQAGLMRWPEKDFADITYDLLTAQFHDMLPGSSIQPAEEMGIRQLDHGLELLSRIKAKAFFALARGQKKPSADAIPVLIYNPHPYPIETDLECEMMLWDQNWVDFSIPQIIYNGTELPTQCEKEHSSINIDWRKRVVFHAVLEPMKMNRFDCKYTRVPSKPVPKADFEDENYYFFENGIISVKINKKTGYLDKYSVRGTDMLKGETCVLNVVKDNCDPWGMHVASFPERIGSFTLLTQEEGSRFSGVDGIIPSVRCIESGPVRIVIESVLGYNKSRAVIRYTMSRFSAELKIDIRVQWMEIQRMLKLGLNTAIDDAECIGQVAFGTEKLPTNGRENVSQRYLMMKNGEQALAVCNDCVYGSSTEGSELFITLLRSPAYTAHPVGRDIIPQDRFTPHMEQGERMFSFVIFGGDADTVAKKAPRLAQLHNERPVALSFYPASRDEDIAEENVPPTALTITGDPIELTAFKLAYDRNGYIMRLFNPFDRSAECNVEAYYLKVKADISFTPYEVKTFRIVDGKMEECMITEDEL